MKRQLQKAIATLSGKDASKHAESLAGKIVLAAMQHARVPNSSAVAADLQAIADLSRDLHRALNRATSPAVHHIAKAYGGLGNFRLVRRDVLAKLDALHRATNLPKNKKGTPKAKLGAKPDLYAKAVADAAAATYQAVTGRLHTRVTTNPMSDPDTYVASGAFHDFLTAVFAVAGVDAVPLTHITRLTKGRRLIAA